MFKWLKNRFLRFRREAVVLAYAVRDPETPMILRGASLLAALYLISPIDLIPITVPFLGVADDIVIVPLITSLVAKRLPAPVRLRADARASRFISRWVKRPILAAVLALVVLAVIWGVLLWLLARWVFGG